MVRYGGGGGGGGCGDGGVGGGGGGGLVVMLGHGLTWNTFNDSRHFFEN